MFEHRSFLILGSESGTDIVSLIRGGYEILECSFSFEQGTNYSSGKATTRVFAGSIDVTLSQLPADDLLLWGMKSRKYNDGVIICLDEENIPAEKIYFNNAACVKFEIDYTQMGKSYAATKLSIQPEKITVGDGIEFTNEWIY